MALESRKRSADDDGQPGAKRQRVRPSTIILRSEVTEEMEKYVSPCTTAEELARKGLRRSIALVLQKVGFGSAAPDAMESFVSLAEEYISGLAEDVHIFANSARRSHPIPSDFEKSLKRHNLSTSMLQPHRKPPIPRSKRIPRFELLDLENSEETDLPILGEELDGSKDKAAKIYIPKSFPSFPSIHTYKSTPESIDSTGMLKQPIADQASQLNGQGQRKVEWPLAPEEIPYGDPKKLREAAAKEAKAGEAALRKLMRASKVASQKESWASAQRDPDRRDRYDLWETAMRELIEEEARSQGQEIASAEMNGEKGREGIADHSMIVNAEKKHHRREAVRATGKRKFTMPSEVVARRGG